MEKPIELNEVEADVSAELVSPAFRSYRIIIDKAIVSTAQEQERLCQQLKSLLNTAQ